MSHRKTLFENFSSLFILQFANYLLPFITFPYLVRVLGEEYFGVLSFAQALIQYFIIITDYGFDLTATQNIAINKKDFNKILKTFWSVISIKFLLTLFTFIFLLILSNHWQKLAEFRSVYLAAFLMVIGQALFPIWFFQGIEKMKIIPAIVLGTRSLGVISIFIFVKSPNDLFWAAFFQGGSWVLAGIIGLYISLRMLGFQFSPPSAKDLKITLFDGWYVFLSQLSTSFLGNSHTFILGLFRDFQTVGMFAIAEKLIRAGAGLSMPISKAIYPRVSALFAESKSSAISFLNKVLLLGITLFLGLAIFLLVFADQLTNIVSGNYVPKIASAIRLMSFIPLLIFLNNIFGTQIMLNNGMKKQFGLILLITGIITLFLNFLIVPYFGFWGTVGVFAFAEILLVSSFYFYIRQFGFLNFRIN